MESLLMRTICSSVMGGFGHFQPPATLLVALSSCEFWRVLLPYSQSMRLSQSYLLRYRV